MTVARLSSIARTAAICSAAATFPGGGASAAPSSISHAVTVRATGGQMLGLADDLLQRGEPAEAEQILNFLSHDPDPTVRNEARFRRSKFLQSQGSMTEAAMLLRQILDEMPGATAVRLQLAQLLDQIGDKDGAWRQVRAVQATGLPPAVARLVDRYSEELRTARPSGASFEVAITPDTNISRATRSNTLGTVLGDFVIDKNSKAESGIGLSLQGQAYRRFPLTRDYSLLVRATGVADLYRSSRFNDILFDLAAGPELQLGRSRLTVEAGATQRWYGQEPYERSAGIAFAWTQPFGQTSQLRLNGSAALVDNRVNELQDGKAYSGQIGLEHALSPTTGVAFTLGLDRRYLREPGYSTRGWRATMLAWRDVGRATFTASAQYGRLKADERLVLFPEKRSESYRSVSLGATFRRLTFGGFAPVTRLVIERNRSTIEFYDYRRTRSELGLVRAF